VLIPAPAQITTSQSRTTFPARLKAGSILGAAVFLATAGCWCYSSLKWPENRLTIKVGVLHSQTGTMAISERAVRDATLLAIEEINEAGGLLGRKIEPVIADGHSDEASFAREAEKLIIKEKVAVIFGCWTSASRKAVKAVVEQYNHLLFYPVQYEGLEQSSNIVYTGAAPNQQITPGVKWCFDHLGKRMFLVGSDYVFPRTANKIIKYQVGALGGEIVGEEYLLLGSQDVKGVVEKIIQARPDVILNTVNGDSNIALFRELHAASASSAMIPAMSFSLAEQELITLGSEQMAGGYATWNYFQSLERKENREFVNRFKREFGKGRVTDDPMEAAYFGVHLWAQAVRRAGKADAASVLKAIGKQSFAAPEGIVYVDDKTKHTWKSARVGKIRQDGQFEIVWDSKHPVRPVPYPLYKTKAEWDDFLNSLYEGWGKRWANASP
jgi:urea transport system substrate-binding protein